MGEKLAEWQLGNLDVVAELEWDCAFNWKVIVENFAECYHHLGAHLKTFEPLFPAKTCWSDDEHPAFTVAHLPLVQRLADDVRAAVQKGMNSSTFRSGRLSHLEVPIWHIQRYLARKIREAETSPEPTGATPYSSSCVECE